MRPFKFFTNLELLNLYFVSKVSSVPVMINNVECLTRYTASVIGTKALSYYLGNTVGRVFSAGESISDLTRTLTNLSKVGQGSVIDYCAEGENSPAEMDHTVEEIQRAINSASHFPNPAVALKITSLMSNEVMQKLNEIQSKVVNSGENVWNKSIFYKYSSDELLKFGLTQKEVLEVQEGVERARKICRTCADKNISVMIDAEQTYFQATIDALTAVLQQEFNTSQGIVLGTFQSYLKTTTRNLENYFLWTSENKIKSGVKLVRGAYMNEEVKLAGSRGYDSPINASKMESDDCYNYSLSLCIHSHRSESSLCVATHNENSIEIGKELMAQCRLNRQICGIRFAQLLGMKSDISTGLVQDSYVVQKYVPFGPFEKLIPYLMRRANEQSTMANEIGQQIKLILQEINLRTAESIP